MATPDFPATLPGVSMGEYGFKPAKSTIRTEMETGLARVRRRFLSAPTDFNVSWKFTMKQMGVFEKFYEDELFSGAGWFNINLVNGFGEQSYVARFKEGVYDASTSRRESDWTVKATLEVVARPKSLLARNANPVFVQSVSSGVFVEGSRIGFVVTLSDVAERQEVYSYSLSGTATAPANYILEPILTNGVTRNGSNFIVPAGNSSFIVSFASIDDSATNLDLNLALTVAGISGLSTITDNDNVVIPPIILEGTIIGENESLIAGNNQSVVTEYPIIFNGNGYIQFNGTGNISELVIPPAQIVINQNESLTLATEQNLTATYPIVFNGNGYMVFGKDSVISELLMPVSDTVIETGESINVLTGQTLTLAYPVIFESGGYMVFGEDSLINETPSDENGLVILTNQSLELGAGETEALPYPIIFNESGFVTFADESSITQSN